MHPWHDNYVDDAPIETAFPVVIEIPKAARKDFFEDYKALEKTQVIVEDLLGPSDALQIIRAGLDLCRN